MPSLGRKFEEAVHAFVNALDPSAEVIFDHKALDRDTGTPRQCDVWINAKFRGHWPMSILVSCKDDAHSHRKLDIGDIGAFADDVRSTGTTMGVVYSNVGFTKNALSKAKANAIVCCRLFQNEPPDIPGSLWLPSFACASTVHLIIDPCAIAYRPMTWNELFDIRIGDGEGYSTVMEAIEAQFAENERNSMDYWNTSNKEGANLFPPDWDSDLELNIPGIQGKLRLRVLIGWRRYRARTEAVLLNGSYCLWDGSFRGTLATPSVDLRSGHPGAGWEEISSSDVPADSSRIVIALCSPNLEDSLRQAIGEKPCFVRNPG